MILVVGATGTLGGAVARGLRRHSFVALRDVRDYALAVVGQPLAFNQTIPIGGRFAAADGRAPHGDGLL